MSENIMEKASVIVLITADRSKSRGCPSALVRVGSGDSVVERTVSQLRSLGCDITAAVSATTLDGWKEPARAKFNGLLCRKKVLRGANESHGMASLIRYAWESARPQKIVVLRGGWVMADDLVEEILGYGAPCLYSFSDDVSRAGLVLADAGANVVRRFTDWSREQATTFNNLILRGHNGNIFGKNLGFRYELHPDYNQSRFLDAASASGAEIKTLLRIGNQVVKSVRDKSVRSKSVRGRSVSGKVATKEVPATEEATVEDVDQEVDVLSEATTEATIKDD